MADKKEEEKNSPHFMGLRVGGLLGMAINTRAKKTELEEAKNELEAKKADKADVETKAEKSEVEAKADNEEFQGHVSWTKEGLQGANEAISALADSVGKCALKTDLAGKADATALAALQAQVDGIEVPDVSDFVTASALSSAIEAIPKCTCDHEGGGGESPDVSGLQAQIEELKTATMEDISALETEVENYYDYYIGWRIEDLYDELGKYALLTALDNYALKTHNHDGEYLKKGEDGTVDLSDYATKSDMEDMQVDLEAINLRMPEGSDVLVGADKFESLDNSVLLLLSKLGNHDIDLLARDISSLMTELEYVQSQADYNTTNIDLLGETLGYLVCENPAAQSVNERLTALENANYATTEYVDAHACSGHTCDLTQEVADGKYVLRSEAEYMTSSNGDLVLAYVTPTELDSVMQGLYGYCDAQVRNAAATADSALTCANNANGYANAALDAVHNLEYALAYANAKIAALEARLANNAVSMTDNNGTNYSIKIENGNLVIVPTTPPAEE